MGSQAGTWQVWPVTYGGAGSAMSVSLTLHAYDPSILEPLAETRGGDDAALRAWLSDHEHVVDPEEVAEHARQLSQLEEVGAPDMMVESRQRLLYEARHGPLAGMNVAEASSDWLLRWASQLHRACALDDTWDLVHYCLDPERRARQSAVHWRFLTDAPTVFDLALYGRRPCTRSRGDRIDPDPEQAAEQAARWEHLFLPYDDFDNDAVDTAHIADALDASESEGWEAWLTPSLPDHVYGCTLAASVRAGAIERGRALARFYRAAADRGHHVHTVWTIQ